MSEKKLKTLSKSEVDAFNAIKTKVNVIKAEGEVSEDTAETTWLKNLQCPVETKIKATRGCTKLHETAQGPVETV